MIVLHGKSNSRKKEYKRQINNSRLKNIIAATKAVARKSILMQITRVKAANGIPLSKDTGSPHQCQ
jgi:hypothetical protein